MRTSDPDAVVIERCEAWERMHRLYFPDYDQRWDLVCEAVRDRVRSRPASAVLDLGCGPGTLTRRLHALLPQARVVGVDADPLLIDLAQRAASPAAGPVFHVARVGDPDGDAVLRSEGPFGAIVSSAFMHYFDDDALRSLHRTLRSLLHTDGVLVTAERFAAETPVVGEEPSTAGDAWEYWWGQTRRLFPSWAGSHDASGEPVPPLTRAGYLRVLDATGFAVRSVTRVGASDVVVCSP